MGMPEGKRRGTSELGMCIVVHILFLIYGSNEPKIHNQIRGIFIYETCF